MFLFYCVCFYHCTAYTVYFNCLHVHLLRVTLNINQIINQSSSKLYRLYGRIDAGPMYMYVCMYVCNVCR